VPITPNLPLPGFDPAAQTGLAMDIFGLSTARQRDVPELEGLVVASQTYILEDGRSLFFLTDAAGNLDIWRLDLHTRQLDPMPRVNGPEDDTEFALTLDARWLVFARGPAGKRRLARVDRQDPSQPVMEAPRVEGVSFPSLDASGNLAAFVVDHGGQTDIQIYDFARARVLEPPFINSPANESFPWLFPDGRTMAFISDRNGNPDLYMADLAGGPVELTMANSTAPELAPAYIGGTLLEFASTRTGSLRLYTYDYARHVVDTLPY
jgi:TolB protein